MKIRLLIVLIFFLILPFAFAKSVKADAPVIHGNVYVNGVLLDTDVYSNVDIYWYDNEGFRSADLRTDGTYGKGYYKFYSWQGRLKTKLWEDDLCPPKVDPPNAWYCIWPYTGVGCEAETCNVNNIVEKWASDSVLSRAGWWRTSPATAPKNTYVENALDGVDYRGHWECKDGNMYNTGSADCPAYGNGNVPGVGFGCGQSGHTFKIDLSSIDPSCGVCEQVLDFDDVPPGIIPDSLQNDGTKVIVNVNCSCGPVNNPPNVTCGNGIGNCPTGIKNITITASDPDGYEDIDYVYLEIDTSSGANLGDESAIIDLRNPANPTISNNTLLNITFNGSPYHDGVNTWLIPLNISGFSSLNGTYKRYVRAVDNDGAGSWIFCEDITNVPPPVPTVGFSQAAPPACEATLSTTYTGATSCTLTADSPFGNYNSCFTPYTNTQTVVHGTTYNATYEVSNACHTVTDTASLTASCTPPWIMTSWGDTFARDGYVIDLVDLVPDPSDNNFIPFATKTEWRGSPKEYFSNYIQSWEVNSGVDSMKWRLSSYSDANVSRFFGVDIYDLFIDLAAKNGFTNDGNVWSSDGMHVYNSDLVIDNETCDGISVTFIDGNLIIDPPLTVNDGNACVFIVRNNITINEGNPESSPDYDMVHGFFIAGEQFIVPSVDSSNDGLYLVGGVISKEVYFDRYITDVDARPSESIRYDPRYFELLRYVLGQDYPYSVREKGYTE